VHVQNIEDLKTLAATRIPVFDFEKNKRSGAKELVVSEDCGVVGLQAWLLRMIWLLAFKLVALRVSEVTVL
jgi:hypothetical protein